MHSVHGTLCCVFVTCLRKLTWSSLAIDNEHETLKAQIEELKVALEQAQMLRKRKIEYDVVAEKVNSLPSRDELESCVSSPTLFFCQVVFN